MKTPLLLLFVIATSSGCVLSRTLKLPDSTPVLDATEPSAKWSVSEVFVRARTAAAVQEPRDYAPLREQLATRLGSTLRAQTALGHQAVDAPYALEVLIEVAELHNISPWLGLGLGIEASVLAGGAAVGAVVGGPVGMLVGTVVAAPVAVVAALVPPSNRDEGEFEATLVLRRRSDGVAVATRHVRSDWRANIADYGRDEALAVASGAAVPELENGLLHTLRDVLRELPPG